MGTDRNPLKSTFDRCRLYHDSYRVPLNINDKLFVTFSFFVIMWHYCPSAPDHNRTQPDRTIQKVTKNKKRYLLVQPPPPPSPQVTIVTFM